MWAKLHIFITILKSKKKKQVLPLRYYLILWLGDLWKICLHWPMKILQFLSHWRKMFSKTLYFNIFFFYSCFYYSSIRGGSINDCRNCFFNNILSIICRNDFKSDNTNFQRLKNLDIAPSNWFGVKRGTVS